jgi:hypothetical protein
VVASPAVAQAVTPAKLQPFQTVQVFLEQAPATPSLPAITENAETPIFNQNINIFINSATSMDAIGNMSLKKAAIVLGFFALVLQ